MTATRVKLSVTLSPDVLAQVDREVSRDPGSSRSAVINRWLRRAARTGAANTLREQTLTYYRTMTDDEREEDASMARALSTAAGKLHVDD